MRFGLVVVHRPEPPHPRALVVLERQVGERRQVRVGPVPPAGAQVPVRRPPHLAHLRAVLQQRPHRPPARGQGRRRRLAPLDVRVVVRHLLLLSAVRELHELGLGLGLGPGLGGRGLVLVQVVVLVGGGEHGDLGRGAAGRAVFDAAIARPAAPDGGDQLGLFDQPDERHPGPPGRLLELLHRHVREHVHLARGLHLVLGEESLLPPPDGRGEEVLLRLLRPVRGAGGRDRPPVPLVCAQANAPEVSRRPRAPRPAPPPRHSLAVGSSPLRFRAPGDPPEVAPRRGLGAARGAKCLVFSSSAYCSSELICVSASDPLHFHLKVSTTAFASAPETRWFATAV